jgi:hypothetical protein
MVPIIGGSASGRLAIRKDRDFSQRTFSFFQGIEATMG